MADVLPVTPVAEAPASSKIAPKAKKEKKAASKPSHPPTAIMVNNAIQHLKERGGSSLQAIKKYVSSTYLIDAEKISPFIKKYLKSGVTSGALVQTKGKGASGSFKLATDAVTKTVKKVKEPVAKTEKPKDKKPVVAKKAPAKKAAKPKKSPAKKPVAKPESPSKAKKVAKPPTKKPKSPKPKSVKPKAVAAKSPKRAAPKRK